MQLANSSSRAPNFRMCCVQGKVKLAQPVRCCTNFAPADILMQGHCARMSGTTETLSHSPVQGYGISDAAQVQRCDCM